MCYYISQHKIQAVKNFQVEIFTAHIDRFHLRVECSYEITVTLCRPICVDVSELCWHSLAIRDHQKIPPCSAGFDTWHLLRLLNLWMTQLTFLQQ